MAITPEELKLLVATELDRVFDVRVADYVRRSLIEPKLVYRLWDYGKLGECFPCWIVLERAGRSQIEYCDFGFGPKCPWGIGGSETESIGMDSGWFPTFWDAFFEAAACELPIWRVLKRNLDGTSVAVTEEAEWDTSWNAVDRFRMLDPASRYDIGQLIVLRH